MYKCIMEVNARVHKVVLGYKPLVSTLQETIPPSLWVCVRTYMHFISEREHGQNLPIVVM